ncbi:hypothetical protein HYX11_04610 [Candidatus Woesearchaeota archaeon]|nr:hypothetical protein [Candidatus Woesearchaeota archaeon]
MTEKIILIEENGTKTSYTITTAKNQNNPGNTGHDNLGKTGIVFLVEDKDSQRFALKIHQRGDAALFKANADNMKKQSYPGFVEIYKVGTVDITAEVDSDMIDFKDKNALLMEYAGSNFGTAHKFLHQVDQRVAEAFKYKSLLTALKYFTQLHHPSGKGKKGRAHGDFNQRNYLCGFNIQEYLTEDKTIKDKAGLEKKMIECELKLCDSAEKEELVSLSNPSLAGDDFWLTSKFTWSFANSSIDRDTYAVGFLAAWLLSNTKGTIEARDYLKEELNIDLAQYKEGKYSFLTMQELQNKIKNYIKLKVNSENYFFIEDDHRPSTNVFVLRPVDKFSQYCLQQELKTADDFATFYCTSDYSYINIKKRLGSNSSTGEGDEINTLFSQKIYDGISYLCSTITKKIDTETSLINKQHQPITEKNELERKIKKEENELSTNKKNWNTVHSQLSPENYEELNSQLEHFSKEITTCNKNITNYNTDLSNKKETIDNINLQIQSNDLDLEVQALQYLSQKPSPNIPSCFESLTSDYKTKADKIIKETISIIKARDSRLKQSQSKDD